MKDTNFGFKVRADNIQKIEETEKIFQLIWIGPKFCCGDYVDTYGE